MPRRLALLAAVLLPAVAILLTCTTKPDGPVAGWSGQEVYRVYCSQCHGTQGKGTFMNLGPSLRGLSEHWDEASLLSYVADPRGFAATDERLGAKEMPAIDPDVPIEARERLAKYMLTLMQ